MLWSLIKILGFVVLVALLAFGAGFLMESEGSVLIQYAGFELEIGPLQAVIGLLILIVVIWLLLKVLSFAVAVLRFINGDETAISRYFDRNRERRGYDALAESMMALASGESRTAMSKASKAEKYLGRPELTNLVLAQAAEQSGDRKKATETYKKLLSDDRTKFVGVRGLMKQKLADGDTETAMKLAERAFALKPAHEETQDTLLKLQTSEENWTGARETINAKLKHGSMPRDVHRRRDAVLALSQAQELRTEGKVEEAQELTIEANRLSPQLVPAAVMAARTYLEQDKPKYASKVVKAIWGTAPHPDLAAAFAAIEPDETPEARVKRFGGLTRLAPKQPESRMLTAELNIAAEDFPAARKALGDLAETDPSMRSLTLMAAVEKGEGADDHVVREWLAKALDAPRDPEWVCDNCGEVHKLWEPVCLNCSAIDTLAWKRPAHTAGQSSQLLPLISAPSKAAPVEAVDAEILLPEPDEAQ